MAGQVQQKQSIGYFVSTAVDDSVFIGGAMVTDACGLPIEFRYTEPVRASRLQKVLYGEVLERFIHTDVILANLFERMDQKPEIVVVSSESFLGSVGKYGATGIWLNPTRIPKLAASGDIQEVSTDEFLLQVTDTGSPIRIRTTSGAATDHQGISVQLTELSKTMEIAEPLRRVESAIKLIWEDSPDNVLTPIVDES